MNRQERMHSLIRRVNCLDDFQNAIYDEHGINTRWIQAERVKSKLYMRIGILASVCLREVA